MIFINDLISEVTPGTNIMLYADDTKIWRRIECMNDHVMLQQTIDALFAWSIRNRMNFHPAKCHVLSVTGTLSHEDNPFSVLPYFKYFYSLGGTVLDYVDRQRDLGIIITSTLEFDTHANSILSSMVFKFNLLRRTCFFLSRSSCKRTLYLSMVRSLIEHCNQIWSNMNSGSLKKLEKLQKRAIKWIRNEPLASYTNDQYVEHLLDLKLLPFKYLFHFYDLRLFYKMLFGLTDIPIPNFIQPIVPSTLRVSRQNIDIIEGRDTTTLVIVSNGDGPATHRAIRTGFFYRTVSLWNKLPFSIRQCKSLPLFNKLVKSHLSENIVPDEVL